MVLLVADADRDPQRWLALDTMDEAAAAIRTAEMVLVHRAGASAAEDSRVARGAAMPPRASRARPRGCRARRAASDRPQCGPGAVRRRRARLRAHRRACARYGEARIAVDSIGATSIGAIIGAGWAAGWGYEEMLDRMRRSFVASNPLSDYTLPLMSLVAGRKVGRLLRQEFGDTDIEDLRRPYYCVSANLTNGQLAVHRRGTLWLWLRASIAIPGVLPPGIHKEAGLRGRRDAQQPPGRRHARGFRGPIIAVDAGGDRGFACELEMTELPPLWKTRSQFRHARASANIMQILLRAGNAQQRRDLDRAARIGRLAAATAARGRRLARLALLRSRHRSRLPLCARGARACGIEAIDRSRTTERLSCQGARRLSLVRWRAVTARTGRVLRGHLRVWQRDRVRPLLQPVHPGG